MKILVISATFPPRRFGGITAASYNLAKGLVARKHEVMVYTTDLEDNRSRIPNIQDIRNLEGINVRYFKNINNWLASRRLFLPKGLVKVTKKELGNFDIIHLHDFRTFQSVVVHHYAKQYSIPYVLQAHGSLVTYFQKGTVKRIFDRLWGYKILKDASKVIALTKTEAEQYRSMGVSKDKVEIVPNGINPSEFENLPQKGQFREKYGLGDSQKVILYLSRINRIKGPDLLAKAFAGLSKDLSQVKLVIAGPDDGYLSALEVLVRELKIEEKVLFTGPLYGEEKLRAYVDADIYVLPSIYETFPVTVLEACACGTPVIVTDRCGIADVIDGQAGLVVPYDKDQLACALSHVLSDDRMRRGFGERGKLLIREQFTWPRITAQVENIYENCISSGR